MADILDLQADQAAKTKEQQQASSSGAASSGPFKVTTINGKKVILDKDGKPCRTCNSFATFASATAALGLAKPAVAEPPKLPDDCPPDVEALGRSTWTLLHSLAATYPPTATPEQQKEMGTFMRIFSRVYPCWYCAKDFENYLDKPETKLERYLGGRKEFGDWMCNAHNAVNRKLGKDEFDCSKWEQRWKDGWENGRCG